MSTVGTPRPTRSDPPDIAELKALQQTHPDLRSAVELQIGLVELQRRIGSRVPLPSIVSDQDLLRTRQATRQRLLRFEDIPLDWTDFRTMFREVAELLHRHDALDDPDHRRAQALTRESHALETLAREWYDASDPSAGSSSEAPAAMLAQVVLLAMRATSASAT